MATTINAGRVAMVPKGAWSDSTAYTNLDIVTHNGSSWICIQSNTGNEPADGSIYWQLSAQGIDPSNYYSKTELDSPSGKQDKVRAKGTNYMGYKELDATQSFASQVAQTDTIYVVQTDFTLSSDFTMPENSVLRFDGGKIVAADGTTPTLTLNNTSIESAKECFGEGITIVGKALQEANPDWFVGSDADKIEKAIEYFYDVKLSARDYHITRAIVIRHSFALRGSSFPEMYLSTRSRTRLIAEFTSATESENTILSILGIPAGSAAQKYLSVLIENVSFMTSSDASYRYKTNGVSISTPGGPSRPIVIRNCDFSYLKKGFYAYGSTSSSSTNAGRIEIMTCNISRNNFGIYAEGSSAMGGLSIDSCVMESNNDTAIYMPVDANGYYPAFGYVKLRNILMEAQPKPIDIAISGSLIIEGCNFESGNQAEIVKIVGGTGAKVFMKANVNSTYGNLDIRMSNITLEEYNNYFRHTPTLTMDKCFVNCELSYIDHCNQVFYRIKENYKTKDVPTKVVKLTPNVIDNGIYFRSFSSYTAVSVSESYAAGAYRFAVLALTRDRNNSISFYKGNGEYWFQLTYTATSPLNVPYMILHDYELEETSTLQSIQVGVGNDIIEMSSICVFAYTAYIPRVDFNEYANTFNPSNIITQGLADMFIAGSSKRPTFYNGSTWVDADGYTPALSRGTTAERPAIALDVNNTGFRYWDTDLWKNIYSSIKQESYVELTPSGVSNTQKYISNPIAEGTLAKIYAKQVNGTAGLSGVKFIFCKTNSSTDEGIEIPFVELVQGTTYKDAWTDFFTAPDPSVYPYIFVKTEFTGYTFFREYPYTLYWGEADGAAAGVKRNGTTANRPANTDIYVGFEYFDTTLGLKVVWNGSDWIVLPKYEVVSALPATPDSNTLYLIEES